MKKFSILKQAFIQLIFWVSVILSFKYFKYEIFIQLAKGKSKKILTTAYTNLHGFDVILESANLYFNDILLALLLFFISWLVFSIPGKKLRIGALISLGFFGILMIILAMVDALFYQKFYVPLNSELLSIAIYWPDKLLRAKRQSVLPKKFIYDKTATIFALILLYILFITLREKIVGLLFHRYTKILSILFSLFIILIFFIGLFPKPRAIDGLEKNYALGLLEDLYSKYKIKSLAKDGKYKAKYIKEYPIPTGYFHKTTGLQNLDPAKTNVLIVLLESTSYNYLNDNKLGPLIFPFLFHLRNSPNSIRVSHFYTPAPHSSTSRAAIFTGTYINPNRFFREDEKYKKQNIVSYLTKAGHKSFYIHTCDLSFDNQISYFQNLGFTAVLDGQWFDTQPGFKKLKYKASRKKRIKYQKLYRLKAKDTDPRDFPDGKTTFESVGWGFDDIALSRVGMPEVFKQTRISSGAPKDVPYFVVFSTIGSHFPYEIPVHFLRKLKLNGDYRKLRVKKIRKSYILALRYQDEVVSDLFRKLYQNGESFDDTLVIVLADHGESFPAQHGYKYHNYSLYNEEVMVPFFMYHPSFKNSKIKDIQQGFHLDIFPTLADIFNLQIPENINGRSLFNLNQKRTIYLNSFTKDLNLGKVENGSKFIFNTLKDTLYKFDVYKDLTERKPEILNKKSNNHLIEELTTMRNEIVIKAEMNNSYEK